MTLTTDKAIAAILAADETIKSADAKKALAILRGTDAGQGTVLTRAEAAQRLRVVPRTVTRWAREGLLRCVVVPGRKAAHGYTLASVEALLQSGEG